MLSALALATIDPRVKLLLLMAVSTLSLVAPNPLTLAALLLLVLASLLLGAVPPRRLWRQARTLLSMIALIFLLQCLFRRGGEAVLQLWGRTLVTEEGLYTAAQVALRLLIIVSSALLALTGELRDYLLALSWCRLPDEVVYMVLAALRFIPLLREEGRDVYAAMQMRGCDLEGSSWPGRARLYVTMLLPITAGALHRAERMALAMEARGFRSCPRRSHWRSLRFSARDGLYAAVYGLLLALVMIYAR